MKAFIFGSETIVGKALCDHLSNIGMNLLLIESQQPLPAKLDADIAFNACLQNYGLGKHLESPAELFQAVHQIEGRLIPLASQSGVKKFVNLIPNCVYPANIPIPFQEEHLWNGPPDASVFPYAQAKRNLMVQANAYHKQYGYNAINLIITAVYGPNDSFDRKNAQVIPSMIVKLDEGINQKELHFWGTGNATREFIFSQDLARMIWSAASQINTPEPFNICTGIETPIKELANLLKNQMGYQGTLVWDSTKPEGILRKCLSSEKFLKLGLPYESISLEEGLRKTIDWYYANRCTCKS